MRRRQIAVMGILAAATVAVGGPTTWMGASAETQIAAADGRQVSKTRLKGRVEREIMQAEELMGKRDYEQAAEVYHNFIQKNTKNATAIAGYGLALGKQFKLDAAEEQCNKALALDGANANAHIGKALVTLNRLQSSNVEYMKMKDSMLKQAENECRQALTTDPYSPDGHYYLAQALKEQGRLDEAVNEYKEAIKSDDKMSEAYAGLGLVKLTQGSTAEAISAFQSAIRNHSGNATAHYGLGRAYLTQGMLNDAYNELNTAMAQYNQQHIRSGPVNLAMGDVLNAQGNINGALKFYRESIQIKAETPDAYMRVADIRDARGDIELAISELRGGLEAMPNNMDLHQRIGDESLKLEKLDDAMKEYQTILNSNPSNAAAAKGITRCYYLKSQKEAGGAFLVSNEYESAKAMMEKAIQLNPNDMELRLAAAKLRSLSGETIDLNSIGTPRTDGERIAYAEACLAQNRFKDAQEQMNTVIASANDAKQTFAVADLALMIRDLDSAEAAYRKANSYTGAQERAKRGGDLVAKAREKARQDLTLADDLSKRKQLASAIDKYHDAIFDNPKTAQARMGVASALEGYKPEKAPYFREAATQLKAFIALTPDLPPKELEKITKRIAKDEERAYKIEQKAKKG